MERQTVVLRKVQRKEKKNNEKSINIEEYCPSKQFLDESEQFEKSCLTEEEEGEGYLSVGSHNSKKRGREVATTCESKKRKKHKPIKEYSRYDNDTSFDEWLFGTISQQQKAINKAAIKNDEDMNMKLERSSGVFVSFPRAQFLSHVGIFSLPYTVPF